jgi:hypothetical protein
MKTLQVPKTRPEKWDPGDLAIEYNVLRSDDDPRPPCILLMVTGVLRDGRCQCERLDENYPTHIEGRKLMGIAEALKDWERGADERTGKSVRIGREKLEALGRPMEPWPEWLTAMEWWEAHPEDRPDGYAVMRQFIPLNA